MVPIEQAKFRDYHSGLVLSVALLILENGPSENILTVPSQPGQWRGRSLRVVDSLDRQVETLFVYVAY